jgi:ubiquinone biosynthesis protein COQ4
MTHAIHFDIAPRRARPRRAWRRAFRALGELLRNPERTHLAVDILDALDPKIHERSLAHLLAHPEGRRIYAERPNLRVALANRESLSRMPEGSLGRAYLEHIDRHALDPTKLVEIGRDAESASTDPDVHWMEERSQMTHDVWHVLSGYGADQLGESALLLFSLAQAGGMANVILAAGANLRVTREQGPGWISYAWTAWRRGRSATCLQALPYESLLPPPLDEVRAAAGIVPPERAHARGVMRGDPVVGSR